MGSSMCHYVMRRRSEGWVTDGGVGEQIVVEDCMYEWENGNNRL